MFSCARFANSFALTSSASLVPVVVFFFFRTSFAARVKTSRVASVCRTLSPSGPIVMFVGPDMPPGYSASVGTHHYRDDDEEAPTLRSSPPPRLFL